MDWNYIVKEMLPWVGRLAIIVFSTLGVVYLFGRLLFPKLKDKGKNRIAALALFFLSFITTIVWDYPGFVLNVTSQLMAQYLRDAALYFFIGCVFYVIIGWRFYSRADAFLDKKIGKDDRRKK